MVDNILYRYPVYKTCTRSKHVHCIPVKNIDMACTLIKMEKENNLEKNTYFFISALSGYLSDGLKTFNLNPITLIKIFEFYMKIFTLR